MKQQLLVVTLKPWKETVLYWVARALGLRGLPVGLIAYEDEEENLMTINDIKRNAEESQMNREENRG
jgi:hypothetical protein